MFILLHIELLISVETDNCPKCRLNLSFQGQTSSIKAEQIMEKLSSDAFDKTQEYKKDFFFKSLILI